MKLSSDTLSCFCLLLHFVIFSSYLFQDKTFGLKNKKGGKNQKFIAQVQKQVIHGGSSEAKKAEEKKRLEKEKKEAELKQQKEMQDLFKPVQTVQKIEKGADPKSVLCAFFKQGI